MSSKSNVKKSNTPAVLQKSPASGKNKGLIGWIVLCGPICIILLVAIFRGSAWVNQQSEAGSLSEAQTHNTLGLHAFEARRYEEAYGQFMTALKIKPDFGDAQVNMGNLFQASGDNNRAITTYQQALNIAPKKRDLIYNNLGMVYGKEKRYEEALEMFNRALESGVRLPQIYRNIGQVYLSRKQYTEAAEAYAKAIAEKPTLDIAYRDMLREALLQMDDSDLIQIAKQQLVDGLSDSDRARYDSTLILRYADREPKLADDYLSYAQALFKGGETEKGIEACRKSIELHPMNSAAHNRLGVMYASTGDLTNAEEEFEKAVRLDTRNDEARENLERCRSKKGIEG